ncbi:MAG: DUF423 domain-containing protein [Chitinophagaceae bacterium]|jgi:uncharacterized membrane protein YgdD (TMEM256/DUF423 family)
MHRSIQLRGIVFAAIAVILGAFGAHALKAVLPLDRLQVFETGVRYQIIHSIALIVLSLNLTKYEDATFASKWMHRAALFMTIGIVLFSGSLYIISTSSILPFSVGPWMGPITPIGGLFFIIGWTSWGMASYRG